MEICWILVTLTVAFISISNAANDGFSNWSFYGPCSKACKGGIQTRTRTCLDAAKCKGPLKESVPCNQHDCAVDGKYSSWSTFSVCSTTCGPGIQIRTRKCDNPKPDTFGRDCVGPSKEDKACKLIGCPVDGKYSSWTTFGPCSQTCGTGVSMRTRKCNNPTPKNNGRPCQGPSRETKSCAAKSCPVDGKYSSWSKFGTCSKSCGGGLKTRQRQCNNPKPENSGKVCQGPSKQTVSCNKQGCPVDGKFSDWSAFGACSRTCGPGVALRTRTCTKPVPRNNGKPCHGPARQTRPCNLKACPVNGGFSKWSSFSACSKACGNGVQWRTRTCTNPKPGVGGKPCQGLSRQSRSCRIKACPTAVVTVRYCEHRTGGTILCPNGMKLYIHYANYGRTSRSYCRFHNWNHASCRAASSLGKVRGRCQGRKSCSLTATNGVFGDPCYGVVKYLEVRYNCV